jgi:isoquinoline 1-oxidoreductase subunit beta
MSGVRKIARRTFLVGSAAVAGGVAFGVSNRGAAANPLCPDLGTGEVPWTPYIRLDQTGVTIITPRADVGQGAYSVLAALVAEELDVKWEDVKVDPGLPSEADGNGKVVKVEPGGRTARTTTTERCWKNLPGSLWPTYRGSCSI